MSERGEEFRSHEEVAAAIQAEFQITPKDLKDNRVVVLARAKGLNDAAQKTHDYSQVERLTYLLDT